MTSIRVSRTGLCIKVFFSIDWQNIISKRKTTFTGHKDYWVQNKRKHAGKDEFQPISRRWRSWPKCSTMSRSSFVSNFQLKLLYCISSNVLRSISTEGCSIYHLNEFIHHQLRSFNLNTGKLYECTNRATFVKLSAKCPYRIFSIVTLNIAIVKSQKTVFNANHILDCMMEKLKISIVIYFVTQISEQNTYFHMYVDGHT